MKFNIKNLFLLASFLNASYALAFISYDPRIPTSAGGVMPGPLATGEVPTNMANGAVCPPQIAPMQGALAPGAMPNVQQQYLQGIHGQQLYQQQRMQ